MKGTGNPRGLDFCQKLSSSGVQPGYLGQEQISPSPACDGICVIGVRRSSHHCSAGLGAPGGRGMLQVVVVVVGTAQTRCSCVG